MGSRQSKILYYSECANLRGWFSQGQSLEINLTYMTQYIATGIER